MQSEAYLVDYSDHAARISAAVAVKNYASVAATCEDLELMFSFSEPSRQGPYDVVAEASGAAMDTDEGAVGAGASGSDGGAAAMDVGATGAPASLFGGAGVRPYDARVYAIELAALLMVGRLDEARAVTLRVEALWPPVHAAVGDAAGLPSPLRVSGRGALHHPSASDFAAMREVASAVWWQHYERAFRALMAREGKWDPAVAPVAADLEGWLRTAAGELIAAAFDSVSLDQTRRWLGFVHREEAPAPWPQPVEGVAATAGPNAFANAVAAAVVASHHAASQQQQQHQQHLAAAGLDSSAFDETPNTPSGSGPAPQLPLNGGGGQGSVVNSHPMFQTGQAPEAAPALGVMGGPARELTAAELEALLEETRRFCAQAGWDVEVAEAGAASAEMSDGPAAVRPVPAGGAWVLPHASRTVKERAKAAMKARVEAMTREMKDSTGAFLKALGLPSVAEAAVAAARAAEDTQEGRAVKAQEALVKEMAQLEVLTRFVVHLEKDYGPLGSGEEKAAGEAAGPSGSHK
ncbi:hypothetical protein HDU96_006888 [Phlyctochytrium bullatum]|nr:hypothetical protein HDU96_006888 [Phlyctochytrium bullatum]